ncbi:MAG: antibiotic biosynthesis monooxygenase [Pseudomonadales bacterium]|nr:antibiotic biosynthesis monooxygenase [Pseudomonadales bacterium]
MNKKFLPIVLLPALFAAPGVYATCSEDEVGYVASFNVKAGNEAQFEAALAKLAQTVQEVESGVILYAPYRGVDGQYFMMERYENEAARAAHGKAPEVAALFPTLGPHMAGAPDIQPVSAVCP